jgi:hypothetical protein
MSDDTITPAEIAEHLINHADPCMDYAQFVPLAESHRDLLVALRDIARIAHNQTDDNLSDATGPNDARMRGLMYCAARDIARRALARATGGAA